MNLTECISSVSFRDYDFSVTVNEWRSKVTVFKKQTATGVRMFGLFCKLVLDPMLTKTLLPRPLRNPTVTELEKKAQREEAKGDTLRREKGQSK